MACRRTLQTVALLFVSLAMACAGTPDVEETPPDLSWDQAAVTALANELSTSVDKLLQRVRNADTSSNPRQDRIRSMAQDKLQRVQSLSRQLALRLGKGDGREATTQIVRNIMTLRDDMVTLTRSAATGQEVDELLEAAGAALRKLSRYYPAS